jgi:1,4-dihydroxy-2-naphthoate octaprenyltransferase
MADEPRTGRRDRPPVGHCRPTAGKLLRSLRAFSLLVSVLPVFVATAVALPPSQWDIAVLVLSAAGAALLHLGGNLLNDYFDFRSGVDRLADDDASRPGRLLVTGQLRPRAVLVEAAVMLAAAAVVTAVLVWLVGAGLLAFGAAALVMLYSYTGPPLRLKYRAMGEAVIFVTFGPLLMVGAAWAQLQRIDAEVLLMSVPVGLATTAVVVGNAWRDRAEDAEAGIRTIGQFRGGDVARIAYVVLVCTAAFMPAAIALAGLGPLWLLASPLALLLAAGPVRATLARRRLADIDARTARFAAGLMAIILLAYAAG